MWKFLSKASMEAAICWWQQASACLVCVAWFGSGRWGLATSFWLQCCCLCALSAVSVLDLVLCSSVRSILCCPPTCASVHAYRCVCLCWFGSGCHSLQGAVQPTQGKGELGLQDLHRVTEWLGLEGTLETTQFQPPPPWAPPTSRPPKVPPSLTLSISRDGPSIAPLVHLCPHSEKCPSISNLNLPSFSLKPLPLVLSLQGCVCVYILDRLGNLIPYFSLVSQPLLEAGR